jgi:prepilin-type N-terminal cleavage/methylation domain-containing protein
MNTSHKGFTILEILIVMAIISIMSAVVVLNIGAPTYSTFIANTRKIAATMNILNDQAVYTNSVIVCDINPNSLSCESYKNGEWSELDIRKLISWGWPQNLVIEQVYVNGIPLKQGEKIQFLPTGEQSPISLQITDDKYHTWVDGDLNGNFQVNN